VYDQSPPAVYASGGPNGEQRQCQASQPVQQFVFLFKLVSQIMQSIGMGLLQNLHLVVAKDAMICVAKSNI
jgi:hypothetical protein